MTIAGDRTIFFLWGFKQKKNTFQIRPNCYDHDFFLYTLWSVNTINIWSSTILDIILPIRNHARTQLTYYQQNKGFGRIKVFYIIAMKNGSNLDWYSPIVCETLR